MLKARSDEIASSVFDGEATLINLTTRVYYALNGAGAVAWSALMRGVGREELIVQLAQYYSIPRTLIQADIDRLLGEMMVEGLIEEVGVGSVTDDTIANLEPAPSAPYFVPILQRFDDMQAQLALDPPLPMPPARGL